jgi:hypothetical protein
VKSLQCGVGKHSPGSSERRLFAEKEYDYRIPSERIGNIWAVLSNDGKSVWLGRGGRSGCVEKEARREEISNHDCRSGVNR